MNKTVFVARNEGNTKYFLKNRECFQENSIVNSEVLESGNTSAKNGCFVSNKSSTMFGREIVEISNDINGRIMSVSANFECIPGKKLFGNGGKLLT